jgi:type IV secretion system protein TrbC
MFFKCGEDIKMGDYMLYRFRKFLVAVALYAFGFLNVLILPTALIVPQAAQAQTMPWEGPLCNLEKSLTGPTSKAIALIALFVAGGLLVFGGELSDFTRRITWMVLALSVMLMGSQVLSLFGGSTTCTS